MTTSDKGLGYAGAAARLRLLLKPCTIGLQIDKQEHRNGC